MNCDISWMVGQEIQIITYGEFENWWFNFTNGGILHAGTPWRLVVAGRIKLSSVDHGQWFGLPAPVDAEAQLRSLLSGRKVQSAEVRDDTHDILIPFESGERLEIVALSSGYEIWDFKAPNGDWTYAGGGKIWVQNY